MPTVLRHLVLMPPWSETSDARPFLMVDDGLDDKILIFCTNENLRRYDYSYFIYVILYILHVIITAVYMLLVYIILVLSTATT